MIVHRIPSIDEFHLLDHEAMISDRLLQDAGQRPALPGKQNRPSHTPETENPARI